MRAVKIILWSLLGLVSVLVVAATWLWTADLGVLKPHIEDWVSESTGREFAIDGPLNIDLAGNTVVVANNIRLQNAAWSEEPQMVEIGRLEVQLDLRSLFRDSIVVELVDIDDVEVRLEKREDQAANWELLSSASADTTADDSPGLDVVVKLIEVDQVHVLFDSHARDSVLDLHVESLDQIYRDDGFLDLSLNATLNERSIVLHGEVGTLPALLSGKDIHYEIEGQLDTFEVSSKGWIDDLANLRRPEFEFSAQSPNIDDLTRMLGVGEDADGNIDLRGSLLTNSADQLVLSVQGNIARLEVETSGSFSDLQDMEQAEIEVLVSGPDLGGLLRLAGVHGVREAPFMVDLSARRIGSRLVVDGGRMVFAGAEFDATANLPSFPELDGASVRLQVAGPDVEHFRYITGLPGNATGEFLLVLELHNQGDDTGRFKAEVSTSFGQVEASGELGAGPEYFGSSVEFQIQGGSLGDLGSAWDVENLPDDPFRVAGLATLDAAGIRFDEGLKVAVGDIDIGVEGLLKLTGGLVGSSVSIVADGPSLTSLTTMFGVSEGIPDESYDVSGDVVITKTGYRLAAVSAILGNTRIDVADAFVPSSGLVGANIEFAITGTAIEELADFIGDIDLHPGAFELDGEASLAEDQVVLEGLNLRRPAGSISLDLSLGLPLSRRWADFQMHADAKSMRDLFRRVRRYEAEESPFFLDVRGELRGNAVRIDKLDVGIGDGRMSAKGDLTVSKDRSSSNLTFSGDIPSLAEIGSFNGLRFRDQAIKWNTRIEGDEGVIAIDDLNLTLGESDVNGAFRLVQGESPSIEIDIRSDSIVFGPLFESQEVEYEAEPEFAGDRLIPDVQIPFERLQSMDASIKLLIDDFRRGDLHIGRVDVDLELHDGLLELRNASFDGHSGWIRSRASLDPAGGNGRLSLEMVARDFSMIDRGDRSIHGDIDLNIQSTGTDVRALAGAAEGMVLVTTSGGRMPNSQTLQAIYGDMLTEILNVINPFYKASPYTNLECVVITAAIQDGQLTSAPNSFVGTDKIRVAFETDIDLKTEDLEFGIKMRPKKDLKISSGEILNPYIKVVGTLAAPRLAVDETGALVAGGAAAATGGLSILAGMAWNRLSRAKDPCAKTAAVGKEQLEAWLPALGDQPAASSTYSRTD